ncbi:MAG: hypothetical protein AB1489_12080 [Acidobacteriota bacterium]
MKKFNWIIAGLLVIGLTVITTMAFVSKTKDDAPAATAEKQQAASAPLQPNSKGELVLPADEVKALKEASTKLQGCQGAATAFENLYLKIALRHKIDLEKYEIREGENGTLIFAPKVSKETTSVK